MKFSRWGAFLLALGLGLAARPGAADSPASLEPDFTRKVQPVLKEFCLTCHSTEKQKGDLDLERIASLAEAKKHSQVWQKVVEQLSTDEMPPKDKPQPSALQRQELLAWIGALLEQVALARAGDPGPVVLRRLSNAEYTYTIRDLTGVDSLDPAREFPADSASGEGFMNVGHSLVMSPSLVTKYLDAAKEIASHAMLVPNGIRFSPQTTRRDWAEQLLAEIRGFYRQFSEAGGGTSVNLQGIKFDTRDGGVLPLEKYLRALLADGEGSKVPVPGSGLSPKYTRTLREALESREPSLLLDPIRGRWQTAKPADAAALAGEVARWQQALWKFNPVGHIGKSGGPKAWMEPLSPLREKQEVRLKIPVGPDAREVTLYLTVSDAGDGNEGDFAIWERPRLVAPGRPDLLLRDARGVTEALAKRREAVLARTVTYLEIAAATYSAMGKDGSTRPDATELARTHAVEPEALSAWLDLLGLGSGGAVLIQGYLTNKLPQAAGYDFVKGWGSPETPNLFANASDQPVRIPGNMKPHSVAIHPSPKLAAAIGWRSPMPGTVRLAPAIQHAHPECGNGVTWSLELRRGRSRLRLAHGTAQGDKEVKPAPIESLPVQPGDLVSLLIGPRDGNHACDLTAVELAVRTTEPEQRAWTLAQDVSSDILAGNPHADRFGNEAVWHFYAEPDGAAAGAVIPAGSLLARWQGSASAEEKQKLAQQLKLLLTSGPPADKTSPDAALYRQLTSPSGPLFKHLLRAGGHEPANSSTGEKTKEGGQWGLAPGAFGKHPNGSSIDGASLCVRAPSVIAVRLPADLVEGSEFVTTGVLHAETGKEGSVQFQVLTNKASAEAGPVAGTITETQANGPWTSNNRSVSHTTPIVVNDSSAARRRIEAACDQFRQIFPAALCYTKIVPVDEVVTLTLYYREDHHFRRLMLDAEQTAHLDRLWDELHYVAQDALTLVDAFEQLWQYATQDADPKVFEPMREPIQQRAAAFRQRLTNTEPAHVEAVLDLAGRAYRRPLFQAEEAELRALYGKLRQEELSHEDAVRATLARVLVAPAFLYRAETPPAGVQAAPVNPWELATRLSYFLWSSLPDERLREAAAADTLREPDVLASQMRRLMRDGRVRRLATEFACAWLHIYGFDELGEKSERHFPTFAGLRGDMYEESIRFFTDLFQRDGSVLDILDADYTFVNEALAKHYGIPGVAGAAWRRVDGVRKFWRGGILAQATTLAKQAGASRTSPILRGNWVSEVLLGEKLPRPPRDVPQLPEDEATESLTVRQLVEKHSSDPKCYGCHRRIDPYGYALEGFDAIGRRRDRDLGDRPVDTRAKTMDGAEFQDLDGLRDYLLDRRREAFLKQFCRKLLGYALGRAVQLSDEPLLGEMQAQLKVNDYRLTSVLETIVRSRQFREIRGRDTVYEDEGDD